LHYSVEHYNSKYLILCAPARTRTLQVQYPNWIF